jgi:hypothetical protein
VALRAGHGEARGSLVGEVHTGGGVLVPAATCGGSRRSTVDWRELAGFAGPGVRAVSLGRCAVDMVHAVCFARVSLALREDGEFVRLKEEKRTREMDGELTRVLFFFLNTATIFFH